MGGDQLWLAILHRPFSGPRPGGSSTGNAPNEGVGVSTVDGVRLSPKSRRWSSWWLERWSSTAPTCTSRAWPWWPLEKLGSKRVEAERLAGVGGWPWSAGRGEEKLSAGGGRRWTLPARGFGIFEFDPTEAREWGFWLPPWIEVGMCQHPIPTETAIVVTRPFGFVKLIRGNFCAWHILEMVS